MDFGACFSVGKSAIVRRPPLEATSTNSGRLRAAATVAATAAAKWRRNSVSAAAPQVLTQQIASAAGGSPADMPVVGSQQRTAAAAAQRAAAVAGAAHSAAKCAYRAALAATKNCGASTDAPLPVATNDLAAGAATAIATLVTTSKGDGGDCGGNTSRPKRAKSAAGSGAAGILALKSLKGAASAAAAAGKLRRKAAAAKQQSTAISRGPGPANADALAAHAAKQAASSMAYTCRDCRGNQYDIRELRAARQRSVLKGMRWMHRLLTRDSAAALYEIGDDAPNIFFECWYTSSNGAIRGEAKGIAKDLTDRFERHLLRCELQGLGRAMKKGKTKLGGRGGRRGAKGGSKKLGKEEEIEASDAASAAAAEAKALEVLAGALDGGGDIGDGSGDGEAGCESGAAECASIAASAVSSETTTSIEKLNLPKLALAELAEQQQQQQQQQDEEGAEEDPAAASARSTKSVVVRRSSTGGVPLPAKPKSKLPSLGSAVSAAKVARKLDKKAGKKGGKKARRGSTEPGGGRSSKGCEADPAWEAGWECDEATIKALPRHEARDHFFACMFMLRCKNEMDLPCEHLCKRADLVYKLHDFRDTVKLYGMRGTSTDPDFECVDVGDWLLLLMRILIVDYDNLLFQNRWPCSYGLQKAFVALRSLVLDPPPYSDNFADCFYLATHIFYALSAYSGVKGAERDVPWLYRYLRRCFSYWMKRARAKQKGIDALERGEVPDEHPDEIYVDVDGIAEVIDVLRGCGLTEASDPVVCEGSVWLVAQQNKDGSWPAVFPDDPAGTDKKHGHYDRLHPVWVATQCLRDRDFQFHRNAKWIDWMEKVLRDSKLRKLKYKPRW